MTNFSFNFAVPFSQAMPSTSFSLLSNFNSTIGQFRNYHIFNPLKNINNKVSNENLDIQFKQWLIDNTPERIYLNSAECKDNIYKDNRGKSGIYLWFNTINEKYYIGSAQDLTRRFMQYYSDKYLTKTSLLIHKALLKNTHDKFSLYILEYCNIKDLIEREQYYIDLLTPQYNILKIAGSTLGFKHTEETLVKMSEAKTGENHPMFGIIGEYHPSYGKTHSTETKALMSLAMIGEKHPMYDKTHSADTKTLMSQAHKGKSHSVESRAKISKAMSGENHFNFGKSLSKETKALMSIARTGENNPISKKVFVYSSANPTILSHEFVSYSEAAKYFNCSIMTISRYLKNRKIFQGEWILSTSKK